jgi:hypothetical protein
VIPTPSEALNLALNVPSFDKVVEGVKVYVPVL